MGADETAVALMDEHTPWIGGAVFLGMLQGLTEFLPVSSSGHLVLFQQFFAVSGDHVLFDLVLHVGTLIPVLWFYRSTVLELVRDPFFGVEPLWERPGVRMLLLVVAASIPTAAIGLLFEDLFDALFATPAALTLTFATTGTVLFASRRFLGGDLDVRTMSFKIALLIGIAQGLAITPGISRSGSTIAVALMLGLSKDFAARFSFLMSVPAILGGLLLKLRDVDTVALGAMDSGQMLAGGIAAMVTGYAALTLLVRLVKRGQLQHFAWYCWFAAFMAGAIAVVRAVTPG